MNRKQWSTLPLVAILLFGVACGSMNRATPAEWDDTAIKADVKSKILEVYPGKTFDIGVEVNNGVATLSGTVDTAEEARRIGEAARAVNGIKSVINNIQVR